MQLGTYGVNLSIPVAVDVAVVAGTEVLFVVNKNGVFKFSRQNNVPADGLTFTPSTGLLVYGIKQGDFAEAGSYNYQVVFKDGTNKEVYSTVGCVTVTGPNLKQA